MRAAIRLLFALTLMGWGQFAFSADYVWSAYYTVTRTGSSPAAACSAAIAAYNATLPAGSGSNSLVSTTRVTDTQFTCRWADKNGYSASGYTFAAQRSGDACPSGGVYNPADGTCTVPKDCSSNVGKNIYAAVSCSYVATTKLFSCPTEVSQDGCSFTPAPNGTNKCDVATGICVNRYSGSGLESSNGASECTDTTCAPVPEEGSTNPDDGCVASGTNNVCIKDDTTGCGTVNGQPGCYSPDQNCGTVNGSLVCSDKGKPNRNCGYANGQQVCFNPSNPTEQIPQDSADHPQNGGNADGNDTNDPLPSGSHTGGSQGTNSGATNGAIEGLGEKLGPKIDKTNSLLQQIYDGLFGDDGDAVYDGTPAEAESDGRSAGTELAEGLDELTDEVIEEREKETQDELDKLESLVGSWASNFDTNRLLQGILPPAANCSDYRIYVPLDDFSFYITIPVCELSRVKPLLEWIIYMLTAIGLWNIFYSGLRLENAKASKGGY